MFLRINQCSIFSACQLPTCKLVSILRVRSLACLILRVLGRLVVVVNLLSSERIYSVISVLPSYRVRIRNPLCVQMQVGHQKMLRANFILVTVNIPAAEAESGRDGEHVIKNGICITAHCSNFAGIVGRAGDSTIVRMISNLNRNTGYIAVDMIAVYLILNGVPYNSNIIHIKVFAQYRERIRGIGILDVGFAIFRPVGLGEETEVFRRIQIFAFNAINLGITVRGIVDAVILISNLLALRGQIAFVAFEIVAVGNAAVRGVIRQVAFLALAFAARRLITVRQKHEVLGFLLPIPCAVDLNLLHANCIRRRIAYCIIILRIIFIGIAIIASLLDVRTAGRCLCSILRLSLSLGLGIGSFLNGVFCGSTVNNRHLVFRCRKGGDAFIVGQRPGRAHGQRHDSRKCSCEQTFTHILF